VKVPTVFFRTSAYMSESNALDRARKARVRATSVAPMPIAALEAMTRATGELTARMRRSELTPRVNAAKPKLKPMDATREYNALVAKLAEFGLAARPTVLDLNCQFRSVADQLYGSEGEYPAVRKMAIEQLVTSPNLYVEFVAKSDESYADYVDRMSLPDTPGDTVTLQAISDYLCLPINLVTGTDDGLVLVVPAETIPAEEDMPNAPLWLAFWGETQFKSIGRMIIL
jgi:hypothetical protein